MTCLEAINDDVPKGAQFTCFTSTTKVQILTSVQAEPCGESEAATAVEATGRGGSAGVEGGGGGTDAFFEKLVAFEKRLDDGKDEMNALYELFEQRLQGIRY
jgi:hypothetical protein